MTNLPDFTTDIYGNPLQFRGNQNLRGSNQPLPYTIEHIKEIKKCKEDICYFAENYYYIVHPDEGRIKLPLRDFQREFLRNFQNERRLVINASRQCGKCVTGDTKILIRKNNIIKEIKIKNLMKLPLNIQDNKFTQLEYLNDYYVLSENNEWIKINKILKTKPYQIWEIKTKTGLFLKCADKHIIINENNKEIFVKDLKIGDKIKTINGIDIIISLKKINKFEEMYDLELSDKHIYFTNGILSHNTTIVACALLHFALFNRDKTVAILANKDAQAKEILKRLQLAYEMLPKWLQQGITNFTKHSIFLENGTEIITAATSSSSIRGKSIQCVTGDTKVVISINDEIYYNTIDYFIKIKNLNFINKLKSEVIKDKKMEKKKKYNYVYKITNLINNKIYIGVHSTNNLNDGYMGSGKLLKRAIEKYGIENFKKEILCFCKTIKEAAEIEKILVDKKFIERDDTYNISLGGNVCILFGKNNGFYGKKHTKESREKISKHNIGKKHTKKSREKISESLKKTFKEHPEIREKMSKARKGKPRIITPEGLKRLKKALSKPKTEEQKRKLSKIKKEMWQNNKEYRDKMLRIFKNKERREKISKALKGKSHPWQDKINKNPEKIKKTVEKHKGMKRSEIAKENMKKAWKEKILKNPDWKPHNKGKKWIHNPLTGERKYIDENEKLPKGWKYGLGKRK